MAEVKKKAAVSKPEVKTPTKSTEKRSQKTTDFTAKPVVTPIQETAKPAEEYKKKAPATKVALPEVKDVLRSGLQFGHETKNWHPKMEKFIYGNKGNVHIVDISKTLPLLEVAGNAIADAFLNGPVLFVGTKRQAAHILQEAAIEAGAHFITNRWAGGLLTNFAQIKTSLARINELEKLFETGVAGRTKYEVSRMKKEWERLTRLYGGIKSMAQLPTAVFIVDPGFESGAVRECNYLNIPVIAMVDTNSDPTFIDYPIPANDDAIGSIKLVVNYMKDRLVELSNTPFRVKHNLKNYAEMDVDIKKDETEVTEEAKVVLESATDFDIKHDKTQNAKNARIVKRAVKQEKKDEKNEGAKTTAKAGEQETGILGQYQDKKIIKVKARK
jgi:small subunit ribosomal protein S2